MLSSHKLTSRLPKAIKLGEIENLFTQLETTIKIKGASPP